MLQKSDPFIFEMIYNYILIYTKIGSLYRSDWIHKLVKTLETFRRQYAIYVVISY